MINLNGRIFSAEAPLLSTSNRAFRYGDGLFESIRVFEGALPFFGKHWQRLRTGMGVLKFEIPAHFSSEFFQNEIAKLTENQGNWRIRLTVFRSGGGLYTPASNAPEFLIEATPMPGHQFELNPTGLTIGIFDEIRLPTFPSSHLPFLQSFKTCNALPFVLAGIFKKEKSLDDCLLLNAAGRIACGSSSNVFLVKNSELLTPPLPEGCVAGTMRSMVLDVAKSLKIRALEVAIGPEDLPKADEIWLTNAMQGIRWAGQVEGAERKFGKTVAQRCSNVLNGLVFQNNR